MGARVKQDKDLDGALEVIAPAASGVVATDFWSDGGDHPASTSVPAGRTAAAVALHGIPTTAEREPATAVSRAPGRADPGVPVVLSGPFHLLAAVHGATAPV